jgi:endogenous inhibitor of DNA gyrase (YacG/DUF329 family)
MNTTARKCPICKRPTETAFAPFCSQRCADADLRQWLTGGYAIPARADDDQSDDDLPPPPQDSED